MSADRVITLDKVRDIAIPPIVELPPPHSWLPANLLELAARPPEPPTIGGLLYPGKRTVLSGETESMKTWLALILAKAEMDIGLTVAWVDLDAMGPGAMLERLQLLGADNEAIADRFLYYQPSQTLEPALIKELTDTVTDRGIRLFVIDAFNPALTLHGLDPHATVDIEKFWTHICDPICNAGAATVLLDHVAKNAETRGKYAYGSERKASGAIVHIGFRLLEPLTRGGSGKSLLTVHKDRPGMLPRPTLGRLSLSSDDSHVEYTLEPDLSHEGDRFRPTILMERISTTLEREPQPATSNWVEENVAGKGPALRTALQVLVDEGYIARQPGPGKSTLHTSIRPYRQTTDTPTTGASPVRPQCVPDLRSSKSVTASPPLRGTHPDATQDTHHVPGASQPIAEYPYPPIPIDLEPNPDDLDPGPSRNGNRDPLDWTDA